jgi:DNA-binding Lrp family transcriptional regulator
LVHWLDTLDSIDNYILDLLGKDGRMSASQISKSLKDKEINMTDRGVLRRLKRLQQNRIVLGYSATLNPEIFIKKVCLVLTLKFRNSPMTPELIRKLDSYVYRSLFCLSALRVYEGDFDYICELVFESQRQFETESQNFLHIFKDLIYEYHIYQSKLIKSSSYRISYNLEEERRRIQTRRFGHLRLNTNSERTRL